MTDVNWVLADPAQPGAVVPIPTFPFMAPKTRARVAVWR